MRVRVSVPVAVPVPGLVCYFTSSTVFFLSDDCGNYGICNQAFLPRNILEYIKF